MFSAASFCLNDQSLAIRQQGSIERTACSGKRIRLGEIHERNALARPVVRAHDLDTIWRNGTKRRKDPQQIQILSVCWQISNVGSVWICWYRKTSSMSESLV